MSILKKMLRGDKPACKVLAVPTFADLKEGRNGWRVLKVYGPDEPDDWESIGISAESLNRADRAHADHEAFLEKRRKQPAKKKKKVADQPDEYQEYV